MPLNQSVIDRGTALAKGATCYGVPLEDMTREELLAVAALGWKAYTDQLQSSIASSRFQREAIAAART